MVSIDFETEAIIEGSNTPPIPVGCAVMTEDGSRRYWAWGHPSENNCTREEFIEYLRSIWGEEFVGHNIFGFDLPVAEYHLGMPPKDPLSVHDTLFLAYLHSPHARSLRLKDLAVDWLGMAADEQTELQDWIMLHTDCRNRKRAGEYISQAPGGLVGRYAEADVVMAKALYDFCRSVVENMPEAYARERKLAPILAKMHRGGMIIDTDRLEVDLKTSMKKLATLDDLIRERLRSPTLNPGSDKELVEALSGAGFSGFLTTPTGRLSANKESLERVLSASPELQSMLRSRATYTTLTGTFMAPWLELAKRNGGTINPNYNQVRNPDGYGTRTGRLSSSSPNGQNIPGDQGVDYFGDPFPQMKSYCLPDPGMVWYSFDFKAQEPRLTAHYEDDKLLAAFVGDPDMDPYIFVKDECGGDTTRKEAKTILLGLIYGMGAQSLADRLEVSYDRATTLRDAIRAALPGINHLDSECKRRFKSNLPLRTLGGRLCYCEPPTGGRTWEYKALNLLIQGSAADQTKEAIIYMEEALEDGRILGTVHDEINLCAPAGLEEALLNLMTEAANALKCDVPMRVTMGVGKTWAEAAK